MDLGDDLSRRPVHKKVPVCCVPDCRKIEGRTAHRIPISRPVLELGHAEERELILLRHSFRYS